jgi:hypothetical protein
MAPKARAGGLRIRNVSDLVLALIVDPVFVNGLTPFAWVRTI